MKLKFIPMALAISTIIAGTVTVANAGQYRGHDERRTATNIERQVVQHRIKDVRSHRSQGFTPARKYNPHSLEPHEVQRILRQRGYRNVHVTDVRRHFYMVSARGHRGPVIMKVSRRDAYVVERKLLTRDRNRGHRNQHKQYRKQRGGSLTFYFGG